MEPTSPEVGQIERVTQDRIVKLFQDQLHYDYLGNWEDRLDNTNIEEAILRSYLVGTEEYSDSLINKAIEKIFKTNGQTQLGLYDLNKEVYSLLRYGIKVSEGLGKNNITVWPIDWKNPEKNNFALAEEVTYRGYKTKRPDIVLYVNGIAIGVIELKRSTVSVSEGIRQNIGNQKEEFIKTFFASIQMVMAGNDTEGLHYATTQTPEKYYMTWKESGRENQNRLDAGILQVCDKKRILDIIHNFIIFDTGTKKICRHNQYFGGVEARNYINRHEGGIIWHTQGTGKSILMVWLAKWIRENVYNSRVLILTDRTELDEQIEKIFFGVEEKIYRTKSARDLLGELNTSEKSLFCSLVQKFGRMNARGEMEVDEQILRNNMPTNFSVKGDLFVFVDECHRTHTGKLHEAMKEVLPGVTFIGFTGTPLLKVDKANSQAMWGNYIHVYQYDEAVKDKVVLDLRYEARRVPQKITNQERIDNYFEEKTQGLTDYAKAQLKSKWGTMQTLLSSEDRLEKIVFDILDDFETKQRLISGRGNAMLVASSISEACRYYDIFQQRGFTKCAVVTSYEPGALTTESLEYRTYQRMLNGKDPTVFEQETKKTFIEQPGQMKLLIVVDKLLTGFDAPPATYLYIDKTMQDHGLFQAICRVNRLDGDDKEYGYIVDYRDLFKKIELAVTDYTSGAFEAYDKKDVIGLLKDRLSEGRDDLDEALEMVRSLCEPVSPPKDSASYIRYFCGDVENPYTLKENEVKRLKLYKSVSHLLRIYADMANDLNAAGYSSDEVHQIKIEVAKYELLKKEILLSSGDYIDLKKFEPAMRTLIDRYISAEESDALTNFDNTSLVDLIVNKGMEAFEQLPASIKQSHEAMAETIENNVRRLIVDEMPTNPIYYQRMSDLLADLIEQRKKADVDYQTYLDEIIALTKKTKDPLEDKIDPEINTPAKRALYDNLGEDVDKAIKVHNAVMTSRRDSWRGRLISERAIKNTIRTSVPEMTEEELLSIFEIIKSQNEY